MPKFFKDLRRAGTREGLPPVASASTSQQLPLSSRSSSPASVGITQTAREKVGLFELSDKDGAKTIDVVAVHGLQGDAYKTWEHDNGSIWLRDFLPAELPSARIMTFGYDSTVAFSHSVAKLEDKALELLNRLGTKRNMAGRSSARPIVFICHSLGGLVVKNALILAHERTDDVHYKDILDNTKAIAFLGVPHSGSGSAWWAGIAANVLRAASVGFATNTALIEDLKKDSTALIRVSKQFVDRAKSLVIYTFYEARKICGVLVVDELSARIGLPNEKLFSVDANHRTICKFPSADSQAYESVGPWIVTLVRGASVEGPTPGARLSTMQLSEGPPKSYYEVPNRRISSFIGREEIMTRIDNAFTVGMEPKIAGSGPRIAVLHGMGGQGKSQVALNYCHNKENEPFSAIFWVDAMTESSVKGSFRSISECIKNPEDHLPDTNARVSFVLRRLSSWPTKWLMVFDSYDNPDAFLIQDFIPHGDAGAILVTSRHAGTSELVSEHSSSFIELPGLEEKDALKLLFLASQVEVSSTNTAVGEDIVRKLGQHPLAITQTGSYIMKRKLPLHEFLNEYKRRKDIVLKTTPQLSQYRRKLGDEEKETLLNVFTTWELSFEQLQLQTSKDSIEIKLLTLFAFFDNSDISERLFSKRGRIEIRFPETLKLVAWLENFTDHNHGWDGGMFRDTLIVLRDLSLLQTFTKEKDGFCHSSMHPLVKDWIRIRTERSICQENSQLATILIESVLCNAYDEKTEDFKLQRSIKENLTKHIIAQIENYEDYLAFSMTLLSNYLFAQVDLIIFLQRMGFHKHARIMGEQAVKKCTEILGLEDVITMRGMHALGTVFFQHEQYDEAVKLYVQVVDFYKTLVGVEHRTTLRSMQNLSTAYSRLGQLKQAEEIQVQIVKNCQVARGPEDFSTLVSTRELARTYWRQGRVEEAEELQSSTLDTSTRTMGLEHQVTISLMHNLACTNHQQGRTSEAIELMKRAVDLRTKILSPSHPDTLEAVKILNEWRGT